MKLTLEQKAFYEYGRAVESLKRTIYETRETAIQEFKDPYRLLSTYDRKQLIDAMGPCLGDFCCPAEACRVQDVEVASTKTLPELLLLRKIRQ